MVMNKFRLVGNGSQKRYFRVDSDNRLKKSIEFVYILIFIINPTE